jgi:protoporphyrinogen/coproporphyrinogen III oxidase
MTAPHVLVVGGGITGLAAAYRLSQRADRPRVTLIEAGERLGGKLRTERVDGFVVDAGPEALAPGRPNAAMLVQELGIDMVGAADGPPGAVLVEGRLRLMPDGIGGFIPRKIRPLATTRLFSPKGKLRMAVEPLVPVRPGDDDESLESFTTRRLGREAYRRLVEPVASGIFCGDPAHLSLLATMPHLRRAETTHGGLVRAVLAERKASAQKKAGPRPSMQSPRAGMGALVETLAQRLDEAGVDVLVSTSLVSLARDGDGYVAAIVGADGRREVRVGSVILAVPTAVAARALDDVGAAVPAATLRAMEVASTATVSLGYDAAALPRLDALLPAHGYLVAEPGRGPVRSVTRSSARFPDRAPEGHELFRVVVRADDEAPDDELVALAREELRARLGVAVEPTVEVVQRWTRVMPQYAVGHLQRVAEVEQQLAAWPGLALAGSGTHGLGIPDCVASAERAVETVLAPSPSRAAS